jgi:hypothetical protein
MRTRSSVIRLFCFLFFTQWYPNVARVEHVQLIRSRVHNHEGEKYRLITKFPLIGTLMYLCSITIVHIMDLLGDIGSSLTIVTDDQPIRFVYSLNSWLLEINTIEFKDNVEQANSTTIEWTVHTTRRSILFHVGHRHTTYIDCVHV